LGLNSARSSGRHRFPGFLFHDESPLPG
jgi:hypothetical protein